MALELVTGHAGTAHVSASDFGAMLAGLVGTGSYTLGALPTLSMSDANTVAIGPCEVLMQGRHVRLTGSNTLSIRSGTQTARRSDLVCIRYTYDTSTTVEDVELVVVEGTAGASASDPAIPNNASILDGATIADVPIVRVTLNALTPTAEWLLPSRGVGAPIITYASRPDESLIAVKPSFAYITSTGELFYVS